MELYLGFGLFNSSNNKEVAHSRAHIQGYTCELLSDLKAGDYYVVPTTFKKGEEAKFVVRVYDDNPAASESSDDEVPKTPLSPMLSMRRTAI